MGWLDRTKAEIENYLLEAKENGATEIAHAFFFTFLPDLQDEMSLKEYYKYEPKHWVSHLEVTYKPLRQNDFRLFHLSVCPFRTFPHEVWELRDWFFKESASMGMTATDSHERIEEIVGGK